MKPTPEQLIKILAEHQDKSRKLPKRNANDVHRFIVDNDLKEGKHTVQAVLVYKAYVLWSDDPYTWKKFFNRFSQYFEPLLSVNRKKYYKLNLRPVELINKVDNGLIKF